MPARQLFLSALIALCAIPVAGAQNPKGIEVARPYAVATMPGAPTGALGAAGLFERGCEVAGLRVGVILSGGNVDLDSLCRLL